MSHSKTPFGHFGVGHIIGGTAFLILPACILSVPFAAPLLIVAALLALASQRIGAQVWPSPPRLLVVLLATLICYGVLSSLWSVSAKLSLELAAQLAGLFVAGLVLTDAACRLDDDARGFFERAFLAGFALGVAFLVSENLTGASILSYLGHLAPVQAILGVPRPIGLYSHFNRVDTLVGFLVWPAAMLVDRRGKGWLAFLVVLIAFVPVLIGHSGTAKVAYVVGAVVYFSARSWPRYAPLVIGALVVLDLMFAPVAMHSHVLGRLQSLLPKDAAYSLGHRLEIWDFSIDQIHARPIFGWGLNSSRDIPGGHATFRPNAELMPLHPHDMALQVRLELGLPGVLLAIAIVLVLTAAAARSRGGHLERAAALALMASAATNSLTGYDLWHPWWLSFLWLSAAIVNGAARGPPAATSTSAQPAGRL